MLVAQDGSTMVGPRQEADMDRSSTRDLTDIARRTGLAFVVTAFALAGPGAAFASATGDARTNDSAAVRRLDSDDDEPIVNRADDDVDPAAATTTAFGQTRTGNGDRDRTRGNDGTNGAATKTSNRDGDDTRGNDGTGRGDGGTRTSNRDGDSTRGNDGTNGAATKTSNRDGDDTRGNDGTRDGDFTRGQDGTSGGDNTRSGANGTSTDASADDSASGSAT
jgi:hypothetical protein